MTTTDRVATSPDATPLNGFERRRRKSRAAIVGAAIDLFQTQSVGSTSIEEICGRAEVSVRTFFNHFETREHLYDEIAAVRAAGVADRLRALIDDPRTLDARLAVVVTDVAAYLAARPAYRDFVGEMLQRHPARGYEAVRGGVLHDGVRALVASGLERGEIATALPLDALSDVIVGALVVLTANWSADERFDVRAEAERTSAVLAAVVRGTTGRPPTNPHTSNRRTKR